MLRPLLQVHRDESLPSMCSTVSSAQSVEPLAKRFGKREVALIGCWKFGAREVKLKCANADIIRVLSSFLVKLGLKLCITSTWLMHG